MLLKMDYFKFRLKVKRYIIFLVVGLYVTAFLYILSQTKYEGVSLVDKIPQKININKLFPTKEKNGDSLNRVIASLVLVCDRFSVTRTLDQLLKYRPNYELFPIILSHDCGGAGKAVNLVVRKKYGKQITYLTHPNYNTTRATLKDIQVHMKGYYHIAAHYGWALNYTFNKLGFENVVVVEDDLDISPDFFEYFQATLPLLYKDDSLWCISAYNDNGKSQLIDLKTPELLYRTDFFPGLGWMLTKDLWTELNGKWPNAFWDDWMRSPDQRRNRSCIHPEISRSKTFGRFGVSNGQFFDAHLNSIKLNTGFVPFTSLDLTFLEQNEYDNKFSNKVNSSILVDSLEDLKRIIQSSSNNLRTYQIRYRDQLEFKSIAEKIGLMDDFKSGVPRGGYKGIVPVIFQKRRLYLVPLKIQ